MPCASGRTNHTDAMAGDRGRPTLVWHKHAQGPAGGCESAHSPAPTRVTAAARIRPSYRPGSGYGRMGSLDAQGLMNWADRTTDGMEGPSHAHGRAGRSSRQRVSAEKQIRFSFWCRAIWVMSDDESTDRTRPRQGSIHDPRPSSSSRILTQARRKREGRYRQTGS